MVRQARDSFEAMLTTQGMEDAGAEVISIAYDGEHQQIGAMIPSSRFVVFARVPDYIQMDDVDGSIDSAIDAVHNGPKEGDSD